ncbi:MAG: enoyl-CoA hydratase-related protein [Longimicrobiales bacterium]|nr:enoyl-CoA hydratase-related protein [Longimicrobiales bacterium]
MTPAGTTRESGSIVVERIRGVLRIELNRPPLNVLDIAMMEALDRTLAAASEDPEVRVVLLTGRGRAFCAGVDVADHTEERVEPMLRAFHGVIERLLHLEIPVVAAVNGAALGGGCELMLAADIVLARVDAVLGQPEIRLGLFPPAAAVLLPRLVGRQTALDLLLSGRTVKMSEAQGLGLVGRVFPVDRFREEVDAYVEAMAGLSRPVLRLTRRTVRETEELPLTEALRRAESIYRDDLMELDDPHEGLAAFLEKRQPVWAHR